jgi:hypothetical protein
MLGPMFLAEITPKPAIPLIIETLLRIEMIAEAEITILPMIERADMIGAKVEIAINLRDLRALEETFTKVTNSPV